MKQIQGIAYNISSDILGKITFKRKFLNAKDYILLDNSTKYRNNRYAAIISESEIKDTKDGYPLVGGIKFTEFCEGDVVLINKEGLITFYYEKKAQNGNALFLTERCNHRCIMCPQPPINSELDKTPFNLKLVRLIGASIKEIGITGGEPTIIGDKLFEIIQQVKKYMPHTSVSILSNGVRFADQEYVKKLALCDLKDLQIDIPIFSDIAEEHNHIVGAPTFYKTIQGIYNLALFHQKIGLRIVVHKKTYKRLPQLAEYIYRNFPFVQQVAFLQMETIGIPPDKISELWIDPHDYNEQLLEAIRILRHRNVRAYIYNAQLCVLPYEIRKYAVKSISDWKDSYLKECDGCTLREACGGVFATNHSYLSNYITKQ